MSDQIRPPYHRRKYDKTYPRETVDAFIKGVYDKIDAKSAEQTLQFKEMTQAQERRHQENKERAESFEERTTERLDRIEEQTKKTNGHVAQNSRYIYMIIGGLIVVGAIVVPLFLKNFG